MSRLIADKDWSRTPLGPPVAWPLSLRTAVNIALASRYPTVISWGPELRMLFNDAYLPILGFERRQPALGERAEVIAATVWEVARPLLEGALAGRANFVEDLRVDVSRGGQQTESYFSLSEVLGLSGHRVAVAYDGAAGLVMARKFRPEVVICDIGLPGDMDGYALARALRRDAATASAYLVALTGYAQPEDQRQALAAGFDTHMAKSPSPEKLEEILRALEVRS